MNYFVSIASFLRGKLGLGQERRSAPPALLEETHRMLTANLSRSKPSRKIMVYTVGCQTDCELLEGPSEHRAVSCGQADQSILSESGTNTLMPQPADKQPEPSPMEEIVEPPNRIQLFGAFKNTFDESEMLQQDIDRLVERLSSNQFILGEVRVDQGSSKTSLHSLVDQEANYNRLLSDYTLVKLPFEQYLPLVTFQQYCLVRAIWQAPTTKSQALAVEHPSLQERLTYRSMQTLAKSNWINDEIVNSYIRMLNSKLDGSKVRIVNSFYVSQICQKDSKGVQRIFTKSNLKPETKLIVPINRNNQHWCFLKVEAGTVLVYDSMQSGSPPVPQAFHQYLRDYHGVHDNFRRATDFPQQNNCNDCGIFMLMGIKSQALNYPTWGFQQWDMRYLRMMIATQLTSCHLTQRNLVSRIQP